MFETNPRTELAKPRGRFTSGQTIRLLIALSLLLVALTVVIVKDGDYWFGSDEASDSSGSESTPNADSTAAAKAAHVPAAQAETAKNHPASKAMTAATINSNKDAATPPSVSPASANPASPVVATNRVVLPPLDVEVVAGDKHSTVHPGSNVTKVEIPSDSNRNSAVTASLTPPTNAAENVRLSSATAPELQQTVETTYPVLGQHARVQGSVVLQAIVGADGTIENLRVLSGPAILSAAAQQAVRQWHFKPYIQNGQPVETKAKITVNFSIRVSDNANAG